MSVSLCGSCQAQHRASARWERLPTPVPAKAAAGSWATIVAPLMTPCAGCGRDPISPRFPHAVFAAAKADLEKESA